MVSNISSIQERIDSPEGATKLSKIGVYISPKKTAGLIYPVTLDEGYEEAVQFALDPGQIVWMEHLLA